jgi:hypothetical protein
VNEPSGGIDMMVSVSPQGAAGPFRLDRSGEARFDQRMHQPMRNAVPAETGAGGGGWPVPPATARPAPGFAATTLLALSLVPPLGLVALVLLYLFGMRTMPRAPGVRRPAPPAL